MSASSPAKSSESLPVQLTFPRLLKTDRGSGDCGSHLSEAAWESLTVPNAHAREGVAGRWLAPVPKPNGHGGKSGRQVCIPDLSSWVRFCMWMMAGRGRCVRDACGRGDRRGFGGCLASESKPALPIGSSLAETPNAEMHLGTKGVEARCCFMESRAPTVREGSFLPLT